MGYYAHLITDAAFQAMTRDEERVKAAWDRIKADKELSVSSTGMEETWDSIKRLVSKRDRIKVYYDIARRICCICKRYNLPYSGTVR